MGMIILISYLYDPSLVCNAGQLMLDGRNSSKYADQEINLVVYNCKRGLDTNQSLACCLKCPSRDRNVFSVSKGVRLLHPRILSSLHFCGGAASSLSESDALIGPRARAGEWLRCAVGNCYERRNKGASFYDVNQTCFFLSDSLTTNARKTTESVPKFGTF